MLQCNPSLREEGPCRVKRRLPDTLALLEGFGFRKAKAEDDEQNRRACAKPIQGSPAVARCAHKRPSKDCCKKVSKYVSNLQYPREETTSRRRTIFECSGYSVAVHASHRNPEQAAATYELMVGVAKTRCELKYDEENVIHDIRPFGAIPICEKTEDDGTNGTKHERRGDTPTDIIRGLLELSSQRCKSQADREKVESIPGPAKKANLYTESVNGIHSITPMSSTKSSLPGRGAIASD